MNSKKQEWADYIDEAKKHGVNSPSFYLSEAAKLTPTKRAKAPRPPKNLPVLKSDVFIEEAKRLERRKFQKIVEQNTIKPKAKLPGKFDSYKCIEYMLENDVRLARLDDEVIIYRYENGTWYFLRTKIGHQIINESIPQELFEKFGLDIGKKIYDSIEMYPHIEHISITPDPNKKYLINFLDGVLDCRTGEILPHSSDYMFFYCVQAYAREIPDSYDDAPLLKAYLANSLQNDEEKIDTLQEIMGVAISTIRDQKIAFFLLGKSNSGKSVILRVITKLLEGFTSRLSFAQLNKEFEPALLLGKWLNISGEMSDLSDNRIQTFKNVVGNDDITTAYKGKDGFVLKNQALFIYGANEMPTISKPDQAYFNRLRILSYDSSIPKEQWIDDLDNRMFYEERGAIVRFAIEGLLRFINNGMELTNNSISENLVEKYKYSCNSFVEFANISIKYSPGKKLKSKDIRKAYERYCARNGYKPLATNKCSSILKELFDTESTTVGNSGDKGYTNIILINDYLEED